MIDFDELSKNASYLNDVIVLSGNGVLRKKVTKKHAEIAIRAAYLYAKRLNDDKITRPLTKLELRDIGKVIVKLQTIWERKKRGDEEEAIRRAKKESYF